MPRPANAPAVRHPAALLPLGLMTAALTCTAACDATTPSQHTEAPAGGERVHQPPAPDASLSEGELQEPVPNSELVAQPTTGDGYVSVLRVWEEKEKTGDAWKTSGIAIDQDLLELCDIEKRAAYFAFDSAALGSAAKERLAELADCQQSHDEIELSITGYTDPRGSDEYNRKLGKSRADAVAEKLASAGVSKDAMSVSSAGEADAPDDPDKWPQARRVDIRIAE